MVLTEEKISDFAQFLLEEEKSEITITAGCFTHKKDLCGAEKIRKKQKNSLRSGVCDIIRQADRFL